MSSVAEPVAILGTGMTDMARRDLSPEAMAHQAVHGALADAGVEPERLSLVVASNAMGGRLCDQGCIRGQSWLRKAGLGSVPVLNVDNSCAGGASAAQVATYAARAGAGPVLVLGVEKMWTGDRAATLAGIEDGLPSDYRADMHARFVAEQNPGGSVLMALNDRWARECMEDHGATLEQFAAAAVKARLHASWNPNAQVQDAVTIDEVLAAPQVSGILTRLMCSSFTDGAAAMVLGPATGAPSDAPRIIASVARSGNGELDYHDRLADTASAMWEASGLGPDDFDLAEIHDATSPEEIYALESLGLFAIGEAGPATLAGQTTIGGKGLCVNPSGGLVGRGHPLGATGLAQLVELAIQLRGRAGGRQVPGARLGLAVNTGGVIEGDAAYVGMHAVAAGRR
ncbi:MAG: thiolase family protein [Actinomycetota bacterium]|nr:thiolase family protein [Actinomycetota bacterium]MDA8358056.1 thiolase family protein [Actinomycetota bacterium]